MRNPWPRFLARRIFRWYLSRFPLRDGKAYFYEKWHDSLRPGDRYVVVALDQGFTMKLDLHDAEQLKVYFYGHYHERYEADLVRRLLDAGQVFADIGANVGYFSLVAATALQNTGQVIAFEPGRNAFERLTDNISLNPFTNIKLYHLAVAAAAGEARLFLSPETADSSASLYHQGQEQDHVEICRTVSLDQFLREQGLRSPDLIKMDVEGAELAVLQGAREMLAGAAPPLWLMEMEEKNLQAAGASKAAIQEILTGYGYRAAFLRKGRWYAVDDVHAAPGRNIFWFKPGLPAHRDKAARLPVHGPPWA